MTAARPKLRLGIADHDLNQPILDGTVTVEGFDLDMAHSTNDGAIHQLLRDGKLDACEYSFGTYIGEKMRGVRYIAIPAFPNRKFRLSYIFVNSAVGIEHPTDLEGRRMGILSWNNTAGIWARGALQHYYGVDLTRIHWYSAGAVPSSMPAGIEIQPLPRGQLEPLLLAGELDALIQADVPPSITRKDPRVRRLFPDYRSEERKYFGDTQIPISHMITLPEDFVQEHPNAPLALLKAFRAARDEAFHRIEDQQILSISWASAELDEQRALMGPNYWAYNVADNRRPLEAMTEFACEQGVTPERLPVEQLFVPAAAAYPGV